MNMPSKESGFRNDATKEDDLNDSSWCQRGNEAFFCIAITVGAFLWLIGSFL